MQLLYSCYVVAMQLYSHQVVMCGHYGVYMQLLSNYVVSHIHVMQLILTEYSS